MFATGYRWLARSSAASSAAPVALLSSRKSWQRVASSSSPIVAAAWPSMYRERRKPWFGSCSHGIGPCPFPPERRSWVRGRGERGGGEAHSVDGVPLRERAAGQGGPGRRVRREARRDVRRVVARPQLRRGLMLFQQVGGRLAAQQVVAFHGSP